MVEVPIKDYLVYIQTRLFKAFMELSTSIDKPGTYHSKIMMYKAAHDMFKTYQSLCELDLSTPDRVTEVKNYVKVTDQQYEAMQKFDQDIGEKAGTDRYPGEQCGNHPG